MRAHARRGPSHRGDAGATQALRHACGPPHCQPTLHVRNSNRYSMFLRLGARCRVYFTYIINKKGSGERRRKSTVRSAGETEPRGSRWVGQSPMELRGERPRRGNEGENTPRQPLRGCPEGTMATSPPYDPISSHMSALRALDRVLAPSSPQRHLRRRSARPECFGEGRSAWGGARDEPRARA